MSRWWTELRNFRCTNDCSSSGCPGHKMRIVYVGTSDHVIVEVDPQEGVRPGSSAWQWLFDDDSFATMVDLEIEHRAKRAAEKASRGQTG